MIAALVGVVHAVVVLHPSTCRHDEREGHLVVNVVAPAGLVSSHSNALPMMLTAPFPRRAAVAYISACTSPTPLTTDMISMLTTLNGVRYDDSYRVQPPNMADLAKALLARGANPNARIQAHETRGPDGTPFTMKGATPYFLAAVSGDASLMRLLGKSGADPRLTAEDGATPLMAAARSTCTGSCEYRGANLEVDGIAAEAALEAVKAAVELGADVTTANEDGQTAMHMAAFTGADGVVPLLADHGANVDVQDTHGETPWSMAAGLSPVLRYRGQYGRHESTATLLLTLGARPVTEEELAARAAAR